MMYIVTLIKGFNLKDLNFLIILKINSIGNIKKIMIFVDSIDKNRALTIYLQTLLSDKLKHKSKDIIKFFLSILETTIKID